MRLQSQLTLLVEFFDHARAQSLKGDAPIAVAFGGTKPSFIRKGHGLPPEKDG
ncbi:hypothetical protein [Aurantiacibacter suaedae]|uniref:hypothetical protein n=1 Tax=Aurantiacibacter suaedae TaxID=2545755 RepID=UPI0013875464|nr:hypothetical protein [Aurantiacibacter suaedae]